MSSPPPSRVYVPATVPLLEAALAAGALPPGTAFAVTPGLRASTGEEAEEDLEEVARAGAARAAIGLLAADAQAPPRRVVVVVTAPARILDLAPDQAPGTVETVAPQPVSSWQAVFLDGEDAATSVGRAARRWDAEEGDGAREELDEHELLWFGVQEIRYELGLG